MPGLQRAAAFCVFAIGASVAAGCATTVVRQTPAPAEHTLVRASDARAALDSAGSDLVIVHGVISTIAVFDSIPPDEVISFELVVGTGAPSGEIRKVGMVMRCARADTSFGGGRRTVIRRFADCPWSVTPKAAR